MRSEDALTSGAVWLDLTRTLTRAGRAAATGIDRVELAWADHLLASCPQMRGLCRTTRGFLLLSPDGVRVLTGLMSGTLAPGRADLWSRATGRGDRPRHRAEATLRAHAVDRCPPWGLPRMAARHRPGVYVNVGHSNLTGPVLGALRGAGADVVVLVHDLIPLTRPDIVPPAQPARFAERLQQVRAHASLVVAVSGQTARELRGHWAGQDRCPDLVVSGIGLSGMGADTARGDPDARRFVMVGTLEPRKNHETVLQAWSVLARQLPPGDVPRLDIFGQPGWRGDEIRRAIEDHPLHGRAIFLHIGATDAAVATALSRAGALLHPSLAEGFGLPPREAQAMGIVPICADLPVLREALGADAVYVDPGDVYSWVATITQRISGNLPGRTRSPPALPRWQDHFGRVSAALAALRDRAERP